MVNITGNAVKFTGQGEVTVSLSWATADSVRAKGPDRPSAAASPHLAVRVTDTGIGIAPDKLLRLFQSFSQADNSTTRKYGGTGLGLAISKRLVECMGGQIGVESSEDQGSTFWFTLPLSAAAAPASVVAPAAPAKQPEAGPEVLLVDDNEINVLLGEEMLHQLGCTVTTATNGREALDRLEQKKVAMIFMDCRMPVMDGFTATGEIRRQEAIRGATRIPIVALTANAVDGDRGKCLAAGMDDYLSKPFSLSDLKLVIERWTKPQPARAILAR
jgi:CheY-like chemotaxis protein